MSPPPPPPPAYNISSEYAAVADVPVTLAVDPRKITQLNIPKKSCKPDDIYSYNATLELEIIERYGKPKNSVNSSSKVNSKVPSTFVVPTPPSPIDEAAAAATLLRETEVKKLTSTMDSVKLYSTKKAIPTTISPQDRKQSNNLNVETFKSTKDESNSVEKASPLKGLDDNPGTTTLQDEGLVREKAVELAQLYLPDETPERRLLFSEIYLASRNLPEVPPDLDVLQAYFLYDGSVKEASDHLKVSRSLKELGFPKDKIQTALLLFKNNFEEALEHLVKNTN